MAAVIGLVMLAGVATAPALRLTFLYLTNDVTSGSARAVFQLDNRLKTDAIITTGLIEQRSGWHWTFLTHSSFEAPWNTSIRFPPGRITFQAWVPDRGGPYRLVLPWNPLEPYRDSARQRFAFFLSYHNLIPKGAYRAQWRLEGHPALSSAAFRVSEGKPLRTEDLPIVHMSSPN